MIHPTCRLALAISCAVVAGYADRNIEIMLLVALVFTGYAATGLLRAFAFFVGTTLVPLLLSLLLIEYSRQLATADSSFETLWQRPLLLTLRMLVFGAVFQLCILPIIKRGVLLVALRDIGVPAKSAFLLASAVNTFEDMSRGVLHTVEAIRGRGLAVPRLIWPLRELPAIAVAVFTQSLRNAFQRAEMWEHRGVDPRDLLATGRSEWNKAASILLALALLPPMIGFIVLRSLP